MAKDLSPTHHFHLVLSGEEYEKLSSDATRCGFKKAVYIRSLIMNKRLSPNREKELHKLIAELNKIGSNINQIARAANTGQLSKEMANKLVFMLGEIYAKVEVVAKR